MTESRKQDFNVDQLMRRIHNEVERRRAVRSGELSPSIVEKSSDSSSSEKEIDTGTFMLNLPDPVRIFFRPEFYVKKNGSYRVADLLVYSDRAFIFAAYQALLRRNPDDGGLNSYLERLRDGASKVEILGDIRYSPEGRAAGVKISGLAFAYVIQKCLRVPILGGIARFGAALIDVPKLQLRQRVSECEVAQLVDAIDNRIYASLHLLHGALRDVEHRLNGTSLQIASKAGEEELKTLEMSVVSAQKTLNEIRVSNDGKASEASIRALEASVVGIQQALHDVESKLTAGLMKKN